MLEKLEGLKCAAAYAGNCIIGAKSNMAKQKVVLRNFDIEVAITIAFSIGHQLKKIIIVFFS